MTDVRDPAVRQRRLPPAATALLLRIRPPLSDPGLHRRRSRPRRSGRLLLPPADDLGRPLRDPGLDQRLDPRRPLPGGPDGPARRDAGGQDRRLDVLFLRPRGLGDPEPFLDRRAVGGRLVGPAGHPGLPAGGLEDPSRAAEKRRSRPRSSCPSPSPSPMPLWRRSPAPCWASTSTLLSFPATPSPTPGPTPIWRLSAGPR